MEASYPSKRTGSVAETNNFLRLYGTFHRDDQTFASLPDFCLGLGFFSEDLTLI